MYKMKEVCEQTNMKYETLKFYCNEGLVPNLKRNEINYRIFDENDIAWIKGLIHLRRCGLSIKEMKYYMELCVEGEITIKTRQDFLQIKQQDLIKKQEELQSCLDFIERKNKFYDDVLNGRIKYVSNIIR
ncbi:MAG: MerR family transcriptional regulator [Mycoplasmatales bacterium]